MLVSPRRRSSWSHVSDPDGDEKARSEENWTPTQFPLWKRDPEPTSALCGKFLLAVQVIRTAHGIGHVFVITNFYFFVFSCMETRVQAPNGGIAPTLPLTGQTGDSDQMRVAVKC